MPGDTRREFWDQWGGALGSNYEAQLEGKRSAVVIIDMQYSDAHRDYGIGARLKALETEDAYEYYFDRVEKQVVPNIRRLQQAARRVKSEVIFVRIASLAVDSRDMNAMMRRNGSLFAAAGSREADILDEIAPLENEIVITKGCSGAFNGTAIEHILRNMGVEVLICCGVGTNYCVETTIRDARDRSFDVIMVADACAARNQEEERLAAKVLNGVYCEVLTTDEVITRLGHE